MRTVLFGYGKIGQLIAKSIHIDCTVEINQSYQLHRDDIIIWAATNGWPHGGDINRDEAMIQEFQDFIKMLSEARKNNVKRIVFFSTFGINFYKYNINPDYYGIVNPENNFYVAGKKSAEIMLESYVSIVKHSSCVALRVGWYSPNATTNRSDLARIKQNDNDIMMWVNKALNAATGFHIQEIK